MSKTKWSKAKVFRPEIIKAEICPYCGASPVYVDSSEVYGRSYGMIYLCRPCKAFVGVHEGTSNPLGRLADQELRGYKKLAHKWFDRIWSEKWIGRKEAYRWLSKQIGVEAKYTHIGMFDSVLCIKVVQCSQLFFWENDLPPFHNKILNV